MTPIQSTSTTHQNLSIPFKPLALCLFALFSNRVSGVCTQGSTAAFFTPKCPDGWEAMQLKGEENFYLKFSSNSELIGKTGGTSNPVLTEENIPSHSHKLSGSAVGRGGDTLGNGPYPDEGERGYELLGTTSKPTNFNSGDYGKESPQKLPEYSFVHATLCKCTQDGDGDFKKLESRIENLGSSAPKSLGIVGTITGIAALLLSSVLAIKSFCPKRRQAERLLQEKRQEVDV